MSASTETKLSQNPTNMSAPSTANVVNRDSAIGSAAGTEDANGPDNSAYSFGMSKDAWESYLRFRPHYPDSQWRMWLDHHQGPLNVLHEIGTGCGVGAAGLLRIAWESGYAVRRAILSDPTASNIAAARELLRRRRTEGLVTAKARAAFPGTELAFYQQPAEASFLGPGSVDMVIACECLHCTDIDASLPRIHESLRPGGTLAAVFYDVAAAEVRGSQRATQALRDVIGDAMVGDRAVAHWPGEEHEMPRRRKVHKSLNFVPFDPDRWTDVRRVYFNLPEGHTEWPSHPALRSFIPDDDSKVDEKSEALEWIDDPEGWGIKNCTADWVRGMLGTFQLHLRPDFWAGPSWRELLDAVDEQGGKIWVFFPASYIMARKK